MGLIGFGMLQAASASNTVIQTLVPEDKRARAMSYYTMAFFGAAPFGSLLAGTLADRIGAPSTMLMNRGFLYCRGALVHPLNYRSSVR